MTRLCYSSVILVLYYAKSLKNCISAANGNSLQANSLQLNICHSFQTILYTAWTFKRTRTWSWKSLSRGKVENGFWVIQNMEVVANSWCLLCKQSPRLGLFSHNSHQGLATTAIFWIIWYSDIEIWVGLWDPYWTLISKILKKSPTTVSMSD